MTLRYVVGTWVIALAVGVGQQALADTLAYWRFEQGPAGAPVPTATPNFVFDPSVPDDSGHGNALDVWNTTWAGFSFNSDVSHSTVPQTGATNNFSIKNNQSFPAAFTGSTAMRTTSPLAWTIEASYKPETGGFRTIVGRDSLRGSSAAGPNTDGNLAALYLQLLPADGNGQSSVAIKFADAAGYWHEAVSAAGLVDGFAFSTDPNGLTGRWYNFAAVSDGATLSLYMSDVEAGTGYELLAQTDLTLSGSPNTALSAGNGTGSGWLAGDWSVGRGLYGGGHTDRAFGFIDEVRISDAALEVTDFLFFESNLSLIVNTVSGAVSIRNNTASDFAFDYYQIGSESGALVTTNYNGTTGWNSLSDQNLDPTNGGNDPGETWDESAGSSSSLLAELYLQGATTLAAGETVGIGKIFDFGAAGAGFADDLSFMFSQKGGGLIHGEVQFVATAGLPGDFNNDGTVNAADYTVYRDNLGAADEASLHGNGDGVGGVTSFDYNLWKAHFGQSSAGSVAAASVPEPHTCCVALAVLLGCAGLSCGKRRTMSAN